MLRRMNGCQGGARAVHLTAGPPNASGAAAASVPAGDLGWPSRRSNTEPMKRRSFLKQAVLAAAGMASLSNKPLATAVNGESTGKAPVGLDAALAKDWLSRWAKNILSDAGNRYCDHELGEEVGWLVRPFLNGFYYGYHATRDPKWVEHLADWADSWIKRGAKELDSFIGWPKSGSGGALAESLLTDSLLGEAMGLRPIVMMAGEIQVTPALKERFGPRAGAWLKLAGQVFEKWDSRGCWREVEEGGLWVVPAFGMNWIRTQSERLQQPMIWHNGGTGGFRSFLGFTEQGGLGVLILSNSSEDVDDLAVELLRDLAKPPPSPPPHI